MHITCKRILNFPCKPRPKGPLDTRAPKGPESTRGPTYDWLRRTLQTKIYSHRNAKNCRGIKPVAGFLCLSALWLAEKQLVSHFISFINSQEIQTQTTIRIQQNEYIQISGWHDPPGQRPRLAPQDPHNQILCRYDYPIFFFFLFSLCVCF